MALRDALLAVAGLHLGFQLVVTLVVYPTLAEVPAERWAAAHAAHSRRIVRVVVPVYLAVAVVCVWALVAGPRDTSTLGSVAGHALAAGATALVAGPTHGRLDREGPTPRLLARLRRADGVRSVGAAVALLALAF